jgi:hypothetical protein
VNRLGAQIMDKLAVITKSEGIVGIVKEEGKGETFDEMDEEDEDNK